MVASILGCELNPEITSGVCSHKLRRRVDYRLLTFAVSEECDSVTLGVVGYHVIFAEKGDSAMDQALEPHLGIGQQSSAEAMIRILVLLTVAPTSWGRKRIGLIDVQVGVGRESMPL